MFRSILFRPPIFARRTLGALATALACALALPAASAAAVDVNRAGEAELQTVKGIGPALSGRILAARTQQGAFKDWPDLVQRVPGLGVRNAERLSQAGLNVAGTGYDAARMAALQPVSHGRAARHGAAADRKTAAGGQGSADAKSGKRLPELSGAPGKAPVANAAVHAVPAP